jgi:hypothetical protein
MTEFNVEAYADAEIASVVRSIQGGPVVTVQHLAGLSSSNVAQANLVTLKYKSKSDLKDRLDDAVKAVSDDNLKKVLRNIFVATYFLGQSDNAVFADEAIEYASVLGWDLLDHNGNVGAVNVKYGQKVAENADKTAKRTVHNAKQGIVYKRKAVVLGTICTEIEDALRIGNNPDVARAELETVIARLQSLIA